MSTILRPPADRLVEILEGLDLTTQVKGRFGVTLKLPRFPCAVVEIPDVDLSDVEEAESQLGADDWRLEYPVNLYFALREADIAQARAVDALEAFILAVKADPTLGGTAEIDAKVVSASVSYDEVSDQANPRLVIETIVRVWRLVA